MLSRERLGAVAEVARRRVGAPRGAVGFLFVDDATMTACHDRFSRSATTTDVLSFPEGEADEPPATGAGGEPRYWGDIVICTDQALRQARALRHPYFFELTVLALHGVLHLLGFDHTRDHGEMARLEESLRPQAARAFPCR